MNGKTAMELLTHTYPQNPMEGHNVFKDICDGEIPSPALVDTDRKTSPIDSIPSEILHEVFLHCATRSTIDLPPTFNEEFYPWKLGHVCSEWREVLWDSSIIWNNVQIYNKNYWLPRHKPLRESLYQVFSRTRGLLSVSSNHPAVSTVFDIIMSFTHKLKSLALSGIPADTLITLLELPSPNAFDNLEFLFVHIESLDRSERSLEDDIVAFGPRFLKLRHLSITGSSSFTPCLDYFPLSNLTVLLATYNGNTPAAVHYLLQQCSSLISANFRIDEENPHPSNFYNKEITAPTLKILHLSMSPSLSWNLLLDPLVIPSLESFVSTNTQHENPTFAQAMKSLISRSKCSLSSLTISEGRNHAHSDLIQLFEVTPNLTHLVLGYATFPSFINIIHNGLFPSLDKIEWTVKPEGLCALLDLLDKQINILPSARKIPRNILITCGRGRGFLSARARFLGSSVKYLTAGISVNVQTASRENFNWSTTFSGSGDYYDRSSEDDTD